MVGVFGFIRSGSWKSIAAGAVLCIGVIPAGAEQVQLRYFSNTIPPSSAELSKAQFVELPKPSKEQMSAIGLLKPDGSIALQSGQFSQPPSSTAKLLSLGNVGKDRGPTITELGSVGSASALDLKSHMTGTSGAVTSFNYGGTELPFSTSRVELNGKLYNSKVYPYSASGRLEVRYADGSIGICSATLIAKGLLVTAAHCVAEFGFGYNSVGATFYAGYFNGKKPFPAAYGIAAAVLPSYLDGTDGCAVPGFVCLSDVALIILAPKGSKYVGTRTGWLNVGMDLWGYTSALETHITQLGYPSGIDDTYQMMRNDSQGFIASAAFAFNTIIGTQMNQGSSGGPWINNFGTPGALTGAFSGYAPNTNVIVGVTSWGFADGTALAAGASLFTSSNIGTLVTIACTAYPAVCAP